MEDDEYPIDLAREEFMRKHIVTDEKHEEMEKIIDAEELKQKIRIRGIKIHTIGQLKPYIKSLDDIKALEDYLEDLDYDYIYKWMQFKLMGRRY